MIPELVTCVMVTRPSPARLPFVARAAAFFAHQTYPKRELLVVLDAAEESDRTQVEKRLAALGREDIRVIRAPGTPSLGRLRNIGIEEARGQLICVWDDDDIHHPDRIAAQVRTLRASGVAATFLTDVLHLFLGTGHLYCTTYKKAIQRCVPGSGVFLRSIASRYPEHGPESRRGEDSEFCLRLFKESPVRLVDDAPHLYIYVHHGGNTSGDAFHHMVASTLALSRGRIERHQHLIREALAHAALDLGEIVVMGNNGPVFVWCP